MKEKRTQTVCGSAQTPMERETLLRRAKAGDREAREEIYRATSTGVWHTVCAVIRQEQDALDVMQDTYVKAFSHLEQLESAAALESWLRRIAANTARDHLRRKSPALFSDLQEEDELPMDPEEDRTEALPEAKLDRQETQRLVQEMLNSLTDAQRLVIGMYYYQELPVKDIAAQLEIPQATVKSQLRYGRQKIERRVRELEKEGVKLYGAAPLVFFRMVFRQGVEAQVPPASARAEILSRQIVQPQATAIKAVPAKAVLGKRLLASAAALVTVGGVAAGAFALHARHSSPGNVRPPTQAEVSLAQQANDSPEDLQIQTPSDPIAPELPTEPVEPTDPPLPADPDATDETGFPIIYLEEAPSAYVELLRQYRAAALDENFRPEDYPLVDADAIERLQSRWTSYADDACGIGVRFADLDGDGLEEMELRLKQYAVYEEDLRSPFLRLYTQRDGQPVELLSTKQTGSAAALEYFKGGYLLCWENGRYTSPCQLTVYQLLPRQTELTPLHRWTCTLDELGFSQFVSEDGAESWKLAYFDANNNRYTGGEAGWTGWRPCFLDANGAESAVDVPYFPELPMEDYGIAGEIVWREVKRQTAFGYSEQVPLAVNPGTDTPQAVVPLAAAKPEYSLATIEVQDLNKDPDLVFPYITLPGAAFEEFNQGMEKQAAEVLTWSTASMKDYFVDRGPFDWAQNGDILSITTYEYAGGGYTFPTVYNFSVSEGRRLSDTELLERLGIDPVRFRAAARDALHSRYLSDWGYRPAATDGMCAIAHAVVLQNIDDIQITLDRNGTPVVFGEVGSCAGGMEYIRCVPVFLP